MRVLGGFVSFIGEDECDAVGLLRGLEVGMVGVGVGGVDGSGEVHYVGWALSDVAS